MPAVKLQSIQIDHFRGIESGTVAGFAGVNLLVGRNNSGKSTVCEAILRVSAGPQSAQLSMSRDVAGRDKWELVQSARNESPGGTALYHRNDPSTPYHFDLVTDAGHVEIAGPSGPNEYTQPWIFFLAGITYFRALDCYDAKIEQRLWEILLRRRGDKQLVEHLRQIFGFDLEQLQVSPGNQQLMLLYPEHAVLLDGHGDGTRAALRALMMASALRDTVFMMEEPENHQNPGALSKFAKALCAIAKSQSLQLILTTHSLECIRAFLAATDDIALHSLTLEAGKLGVARIEKTNAVTLLDSGVDPRNLGIYL